MNEDIDVKNRIIDAAREAFMKYGFSRVTVDEISGKLGISKKTIYKYFETKEDIVRAVTEQILLKMESACQQLVGNNEMDFVDKLRGMMTQVAVNYSALGKDLLEDIEKNAPYVWKQISEFTNKQINVNFGDLLREGVRKGVFREDIDADLILMIYRNAIDTIITPQRLLNLPYSATQVFEAIITILYEGILTEGSRQKYESRKTLPSMAQQRI